MYSSDKNTKSPGKYCILFKTTKNAICKKSVYKYLFLW